MYLYIRIKIFIIVTQGLTNMPASNTWININGLTNIPVSNTRVNIQLQTTIFEANAILHDALSPDPLNPLCTDPSACSHLVRND